MHSVFQWKTEVASAGRPARLPQLGTLPDVVRPRQTNRTSMVVCWRGARKVRFGGHRASAATYQALPTEECGRKRQCRPRSRLSTWDQHRWLPAAWHSASNTAMNCFASVRATKRGMEHPVAIPLTPPSGFVSAVSLAPIRTDATSSGTFACAREEHAPNNNSVVSLSSRRVFKCSYVHPPGPGEELRGALLRLVRYVGLSRITGLSGSNSNTSCDKGRTTSWSRLRRSSCRVWSFPGARVAPVRYCLALDTSPMRIF